MRARANQGGWIVSYVVVGLVLVLGLVATVYFLKSYNGAQPTEIAINDTDSSQKNQEESDKKSDTSNDIKKDDEKEERSPSSTDEKKDNPVADKDSGTTEAQPDGSSSRDTNAGETEELPATGPESLVSSVVGIGAISYSTALYVRSRREA